MPVNKTYITVSEREALNDILGRSWSGQGGAQHALRKVQRAFGISVDQNGHYGKLTNALATGKPTTGNDADVAALTLKGSTVTMGNGKLSLDDRIAALINSKIEAVIEAKIATAMGEPATATTTHRTGRTATAVASGESNYGPTFPDDTTDQPAPRKRRKSIKRSRAMRAAWEGLSKKQRAERTAKMVAGRIKAARNRARS